MDISTKVLKNKGYLNVENSVDNVNNSLYSKVIEIIM